MNLPNHWEELPAETKSYDDGRNYDKPMYIRKDGYARIYHNEIHDAYDKHHEFAIVWGDGDGDNGGASLEAAIEIADLHIETYKENFIGLTWKDVF